MAQHSENVGRRIVTDGAEADWQAVADLLREAGMAHYAPEVHRRAFEASYATVFVYEAEQLIGVGRAISDGQYQAALYDIAVSPSVQGQGIGKVVVRSILDRLPRCNVILYATPGMEGFYRKLGFGAMKTGMAVFTSPQAMERFTE